MTYLLLISTIISCRNCVQALGIQWRMFIRLYESVQSYLHVSEGRGPCRDFSACIWKWERDRAKTPLCFGALGTSHSKAPEFKMFNFSIRSDMHPPTPTLPTVQMRFTHISQKRKVQIGLIAPGASSTNSSSVFCEGKHSNKASGRFVFLSRAGWYDITA